MSIRMNLGVGIIYLIGLLCGPAPAGESDSSAVLDTAGFWRFFQTLKGPEVESGGTTKVIPVTCPGRGEPQMWGKYMLPESTLPPANWAQADFEDAGWVRGPALRACRTPYLERLFLRGKFTVNDPAQVAGLKLSLDFHGGAVIYLNGQEAGRAYLPAGRALADSYPKEAFVSEDGKLLQGRGEVSLWRTPPSAGDLKRIQSRERTLAVELPAKLLRKGVNVLAVELTRAPFNSAVEELMATSKNHGDHQVYELAWNTCEIRRVQLTATSSAGLVPAAVRPEGFQVWNSDSLATDFDQDFGDSAEPLKPISLAGPRNGTFSGKVVLGSNRPIKGLAATMGDLKGEGGVIPAAQVRVRYGMPWSEVIVLGQDNNELLPYPGEITPLMALFDAPPKEIPVYQGAASSRTLKLPGQPAPVFGAVVPIWVTVKVPPDARPGMYAGQVSLSAEGLKPVSVLVQIKVLDWKLQDPYRWRTWVELIQSPDTLALEYNLPSWSEKHWALMAQSMNYLREVGSKVLFVPLLAQSNVGNAESMVRWIKKGAGAYEYDFSIMDKYLDLAEQRMGKPEVVIFNVWDRYLTRQGSGGRDFQKEAGLKVAGKPLVTLVDPSTGQTENQPLPEYEDSASAGLWKPLFDQLRERMRKRGLEKTMQLGMVSDFWATKEQVQFLKEASGDLPWANAGHYTRKNLYDGLAQFGYQSSFFGTSFGYTESQKGWARSDRVANFERVALDYYSMGKWRALAELSVTGNVCGIGRLGGDTWYVAKDKSGNRKARAWERFPGGNWGYLNCNSSALAPGPDGAVATMRYEELREGAQEAEARILIEQALADPARKSKLDGDLAGRCQALLAERHAFMWKEQCLWQAGANYNHEASSWRERPSIVGYTWFLGTDWESRTEKLFVLAGEVDRKAEIRDKR